MKSDLVDTIGVGMETIVTEFIDYIQGNEQTGGDAYSHSQYVDACKELSLENVANGDCEIVFEHGMMDISKILSREGINQFLEEFREIDQS